MTIRAIADNLVAREAQDQYTTLLPQSAPRHPRRLRVHPPREAAPAADPAVDRLRGLIRRHLSNLHLGVELLHYLRDDFGTVIRWAAARLAEEPVERAFRGSGVEPVAVSAGAYPFG